MRNLSYSVLQYRHDRALQEAVNVGVLAFSFDDGEAAFEYDRNYGQLSDLYSNFDGPGFRSALRRLGHVVAQLNLNSKGRLIHAFDPKLRTAEQLLTSIWPDKGASIVASPSRFVASENIQEEAKRLFDRLVQAARPGRSHRGNRKDEDVWASIVKRMSSLEGLAARFQPLTFGAEIDLDFVMKRERDSQYVAIEPTAFDYVNASSVKERTFEIVGKASGLKDIPDFDKLIVVVGDVRRNNDVNKTVGWAERYMRENGSKLRVTSEQQFDQSLLNL